MALFTKIEYPSETFQTNKSTEPLFSDVNVRQPSVQRAVLLSENIDRDRFTHGRDRGFHFRSVPAWR